MREGNGVRGGSNTIENIGFSSGEKSSTKGKRALWRKDDGRLLNDEGAVVFLHARRGQGCPRPPQQPWCIHPSLILRNASPGATGARLLCAGAGGFHTAGCAG